MDWLKKLFLLSNFSDEIEKARIKSFLRSILLFAIVTTIFSTAMIVSASQGKGSATLMINAALLAMLLLAWLALQMQHIHTSSLILILAMWAYTSVALYGFGGLNNPVSGVLLVLILVGGTLLGQFGVVLTVVLTIVTSLTLSYLAVTEQMPPAIAPTSPIQTWVVYISTVIAAGVVMYLWFNNLKISMERARREIAERKRVETELRESENRYRQAITAANAVPYVRDYSTNSYIFMGEDIEKITGYAAAEMTPNLLETLIEEVIMRGDLADFPADEAGEKIRSSQIKNSIWRGDLRIHTKNGESRWVSDASIQVEDKSGYNIGAIGILQDITERKHDEDALLQSESRLRSLLATIPDLILILDQEGRYLEIFTGREDLLVAPRQELLGNSLGDNLRPALVEKMLAVIDKAVESSQIQEFEYFLPTMGEATWFQARVMAYNVQHQTYVMWLARDITTRKEAEAQQQRRREMLEKVVELGKAASRINELDECLRTIHQSIQKGLGFDRVGLFLYDGQTRILRGTFGTSVTGEMEDTRWFVQSIDEYSAWDTVLSDPKGFVFVEDFQANNPDLPPENEMVRVKQHITVAAWVGEKPVAVISADNAITQRRITEEQAEALRLFAGYAGLAIENARFNSMLEQRVKDRTVELEETLRELESFSYTVSHDLRAPLRGMSGYAHMLEAEYGENLPAAALAHIQKIKNNAKTMGELVDGLLTFSRLGRQSFTKHNLNLEALVREILKESALPGDNRKIEFTVGDLPLCHADRMLMRLVLENLIANAIKFTRPRNPARIEINAEQGDGKTVYFVRDNGVGFDMRYAHKLFGVFQRLHAQDEFEGTGVGLAIVQRIIHKHGGTIWAEGEVDKGATFYFTLE